MAITFLKNFDNNNIYNFHEGENYILQVNSDGYFYQRGFTIENLAVINGEIVPVRYEQRIHKKNEFNIQESENKYILDLRSMNKKNAFIQFSNGPTHWIESMVLLMSIYEADPLCKFYIKFTYPYSTRDLSLHFFVPDFLKEKNIDYEIIFDNNYYKYVLCNDFYYFRPDSIHSNNMESQILKYFEDYIDDKDILPTKHAYIGRKYQTEEFRFNKNPELEDVRVRNENILTNYLENKGIEIIFPEHFINFKQQLNYFYRVKSIISVTSSGIANCLFMQPGGNVFELTTALVLGKSTELHHMYKHYSYEMNHRYFSISNKEKEAVHLINEIEKSRILDFILNE